MSFTRVAVLNRGDAAMRFLRTARELANGAGPELEVVAVYTDPDRDAPFVRLADDSISLGPALRSGRDGGTQPAYCDHDLVVERLLDAGCEAVWPGWGFVSEDPVFVERLDEVGITFIGPPAAAMRTLGDKVRAKELAERCGVPLAPWVELPLDGDPASWAPLVAQVGYPVMVKAANGGGGRGIRRVDDEVQLVAAVRAVRAEAESAFGGGAVFAERCVQDARHVEVQFVVGVDGRADTLGVRDCSLQRRHQKVIEESPSPVLAPVEEERLTRSTALLAERAGYRGVGTAEFLYVPSERTAAFCEVNARLQVEHTVTELVWGVDLVRAQIEIALGRAHERSAGPRGWAVEARVVAEDAERGFAPAPGRVLVHRPAAGPNVRVDAGIRAGSEIPPQFDSMIAKVLAWGPTRDRAIASLSRAVREYEVLVEDGATNRGVLLDLLQRDEVLDATATTTWLETVTDLGAATRTSGALVALAVAAIELAGSDRAARVEQFFRDARTAVPSPDPAPTRPVEVELTLRGERHPVSVRHLGGARWLVGPAGKRIEVHFERLDDHAVVVQLGGRSWRVLVHRGAGGVAVDVDGTLHRVQETDLGVVRSPGPALVVALAVDVGDVVEAGQRIGTIEAMKTEAPLVADVAGVVERVLVPVGTQVRAGDPVVVLKPVEGPAAEERSGGAQRADVWSPADPDAAEGAPHATGAAGAAGAASPGHAAATGPQDEVHSVLDVLDAVLLGYEFSQEDLDLAVEQLDRVDGTDGSRDWSELSARVATFVQSEAIFERNLLLLDDHSAAISAEAAFHDLCRSLAEGRGQVLPELQPLLASLLPRYGLHDGVTCEQPASSGGGGSEELRTALWRLYATRTRLADRERLTIALIRALAALARAGTSDDSVDRAGLVWHLAEVERVAAGSMPALADVAVLVRTELDTPGRGVRSLEPRTVAPETVGPLQRYVDVDVDVLDALANDSGHAVVARVVSRSDRADARTVLAIELLQAPEDLDRLSEDDLAPFAELFEVGVARLRRRREEHARSGDRDAWWAAVHVVLHGVAHGDAGSLLALSNRFEPGTRGLALQDFTVALAPVASPTAPVGAVGTGAIEFSLRRRGHARLEIDVAEGGPIARPRSALDRRALTAKRLGVVDPWELIGLLEGRVRDEDLPHPSLADGRFVEHDLAGSAGTESVDSGDPVARDFAGRTDRLVPVDRPPAEHSCSVIVGVVANPLPGRSGWVERVFIAGDPLRSMGSLGEQECRRIIAAIDLAEERGVPVEWVSISSGARIAWDSGTENLDWTAAVLRRIVEFTRNGGEIDVVVAGINVGAQSYWNAEATMLMHTRGILVMTPNASMVLTGKRALEFSGSVGAHDEVGIGGHDRIMGPNGQSQYRADDLAGAYAIVMDHYALTSGDGAAVGEASTTSDTGRIGRRAAVLATSDPVDRDICVVPYKGGDEGFATVGEIFDPVTNPGRKRPFAVRSVMSALVDADAGRLERWRTMADADGAVVWETRVGGHPVSLIGIESRPRQRRDAPPVDGPVEWAGGTLYPASSKKVARALRAASGNRAAVILANLSGFDGSPESLRRLQLEYGAEIARAVVEFDGPIVFVVIGRYHGGAYVVFSKRLNERLTAIALDGSYASVIGGAPAAAVVLTRDVRERAARDERVLAAQAALEEAADTEQRLHLVEALDAARTAAVASARAEVAAEFDAVHTVERAVSVGSLDAVIAPERLRPEIIRVLSAGWA